MSDRTYPQTISGLSHRADTVEPICVPITEQASNINARLESLADELRRVIDRISGPVPTPVSNAPNQTMIKGDTPHLELSLNRISEMMSVVESQVSKLRVRFE